MAAYFRKGLTIYFVSPSFIFTNLINMLYLYCFIGRSSNGRTEAFEAFNLGSIPSLPANLKTSPKARFSFAGEATELLQSRLGIEKLFIIYCK